MTTIDRARSVPGAIKEADDAQARGISSAQLKHIAGGLDTGFFSFGTKKTRERLFAAAEILAGRESATTARAQQAASPAAPEKRPEPVVDLAAQMRARTVEARESHERIATDQQKRIADLAAGWKAFESSPEVKAFAEYVDQKHNSGNAKPDFPNVTVIPLCSFPAPDVKLVSPGLSHEGLNLAFAIRGKADLPFGMQTLVVTPHGLRIAGDTVGSASHTRPVDTEALARAGFSLSQIEERVKDAMKLVLEGKGSTPVKVELGPKDKPLADAARLAGMSGERADVDALLKQVETSISTTHRRQGADAVLALLKDQIPKLRPDDAIAFASRTLEYLGRINPRHGGSYGADVHLWLFHRDYLKIGVAMTKLVRALPVEKRDLEPVKNAMETYVNGVRSTSSCYEMIEPDGRITQDRYMGFAEIWADMKELRLPSMGPGWGTMRDLGWLEAGQP